MRALLFIKQLDVITSFDLRASLGGRKEGSLLAFCR